MNIRFHLNANWRSTLTTLDHHQVHGPNNAQPFVDCSSEQTARDFYKRYPYFISVISIKGCLPASPRRTRGKYLLGNASCQLEFMTTDQKSAYEFFVTSRMRSVSDGDPSLEDALRLVDGLRCGTITPTVSWDEPQITELSRAPRKHLREHTRPRFRLGRRAIV